MPPIAADFIDEPYWWQQARPEPIEPVALPARAEMVVIGSGYAGLSAAIELARGGADVVVLDAGAIGGGASRRAAGFTSGRAGVSKQIDLKAQVGAVRAAAILDEADEAYEHFQDRLDRDTIDCDFNPCGRFVAAHSASAYDAIARKMAEYRDAGETDFIPVSQAEQDRYVRSEAYHGGFYIRNAGSVHSARYHAGLVRCCRAAGARLYGGVCVKAIEPEAAGFSIATDQGIIQASQVLIATGGYTGKAMPWHRRRIIPMSSTIIATERLGREAVKAMLPRGCPVIDTKRVITFARPSPDGERILYGGRARFTPVSAEKSISILHRSMAKAFPGLAEAKVTHSWSGLMAFTFDFLPKIGRHQGVHYALACNGGAGIVMMSWLGRKAALNMLGQGNRRSAFEGLPFETRPFYTGNPWFVPWLGSWYQFRDWLDSWQE